MENQDQPPKPKRRRRLQAVLKLPTAINRKIDPPFYLESAILMAKIGNKDAFNKLWSFYKPIIIRNVDRFCNLTRGFEQYKPNILYESYVYFWDIINKYDFDGKYNFSYYVNHELLERTKKMIRGKRLMPEELIIDDKLLNDKGYIGNSYTKIKFMDLRESMKNLTAKQLHGIFLYFYLDVGMIEAAKMSGIVFVTFNERVFWAQFKMKKALQEIIYNRLPSGEKKAFKELMIKNRKRNPRKLSEEKIKNFVAWRKENGPKKI